MNSNNRCHLCKRVLPVDPILQLKGMPKAAQYYPELDEFIEDAGITLTIRQCAHCGLVQHGRVPVDYFKEVITAASLSEKARLSRLGQMKAFAKTFGLMGKKIVDIGSGEGAMLDVLTEAGMRATGIEASQQSVENGRDLGRTMVQWYIGDTGMIEGAPFDAFICLNYLEHLPEPGRIIENISSNITANAVGFVTVPNLEYLLKTKCLYEFVSDHISYFTKRTLMYAFEANGFDVLEIEVINEENDIATVVQKRATLDLSGQYGHVSALIEDFRRITSAYAAKDQKVAVWGAGHRTLALLALSGVRDVAYVVDSAKFKQGRFTPVTHFSIVPPSHLQKNRVDLVIVMVPGLYPGEVLKTLKQMGVGADVAVLRDNKIEFIEA